MNSLTKQTIDIFWSHAKRYWAILALIIAATLGLVAVEVYIPFIYRNLFNLLASSERVSYESFMKILTQLAFVSAVGWVLRRVNEFTNIRFQSKTMTDILNTCYEYLQKHSYSFFNNTFVGSLVRKVNRFARSFEDIADELIYRILRTGLIVVSFQIVLFFRHWLLGTALFVWTIVFLAANIIFSKYKIRYDLMRAEMDTLTTGHLADTVTNNINLKLFGGYEKEYSGYKNLTDRLYKMRKLTWDMSAWADAGQSALLAVLEIGLMYIAIRLWMVGKLEIGDFALLQGYIVTLMFKVWDVGRFIRKIYESLADANEMTVILKKPHEIVDKPKARVLKYRDGQIDFAKVFFAYQEGVEVLRDFSFSVKPGEKIALIGSSGGGKSTIAKLLFRFFDIQKGKIAIDGQDISAVTQDSLRKNLSLVPQEPILFHRSLLENIRYGKHEASDEEVREASKLAHAHEFISGFPQGYDTLVGERGVKLSGGERQRVAIARAILKNAPILVLDEATSSLDSESEMLIQDALKKLMKGKTVIVIAHRLSTIMQMDRIVVIDGGRIVEEGRHTELLKAQEGIYQKLWNIQAGGFGK